MLTIAVHLHGNIIMHLFSIFITCLYSPANT